MFISYDIIHCVQVTLVLFESNIVVYGDGTTDGATVAHVEQI